MLPEGSNNSDIERSQILWSEMKEGNEFAFNEIFESNSSIMFQYGLTITRERELVKDCIQELFISIWLNRKTIGLARSVRYYLFFSLRRMILKKEGKSKMFLSLDLLQKYPGSKGFQPALLVDAHDQFLIKEEVLIKNQFVLSREVANLPVRQKEIIFLRFYQELEFKEIEEIMTLNNQTVRNILCKAIKSLRKKMKT